MTNTENELLADELAMSDVLRHSKITFGGHEQTELGPKAADRLKALTEWAHGPNGVRWYIDQLTALRTEQPASPASEAGEGIVAGLRAALMGSEEAGDQWTFAGMQDAFFRWPVVERELRKVLSRPSSEAGEPVAWQWRYRPLGTDNWFDWQDGRKPDFRGDTYEAEERPLYAHPPANRPSSESEEQPQGATDASVELEELRFWLRKAGEVLAPHSADPAGTPTRDALVFVNAGLNSHARALVRAKLEQGGAGDAE